MNNSPFTFQHPVKMQQNVIIHNKVEIEISKANLSRKSSIAMDLKTQNSVATSGIVVERTVVGNLSRLHPTTSLSSTDWIHGLHENYHTLDVCGEFDKNKNNSTTAY